MSNEELAVLIQSGRRELLLELWEGVQRYAWKKAAAWPRAGLEVEDLMQVAFLALLEAVSSFSPDKGGFLNWYTFRLKTGFAEAAGWRTERQRRDPLRAAVSLDAPLTDDEGDMTLEDAISDPAAEAVIEGAALRLSVQGVLEELPEDQQTALRQRYWLDIPLDGAGRKAHDAALRALRHPSMSRRLREVWRD